MMKADRMSERNVPFIQSFNKAQLISASTEERRTFRRVGLFPGFLLADDTAEVTQESTAAAAQEWVV